MLILSERSESMDLSAYFTEDEPPVAHPFSGEVSSGFIFTGWD